MTRFRHARRAATESALTERDETNSVAIASNQACSGWTGTFTDPRLCAAIIDRLTFAGLIIETGTDSYRLAHAKAPTGCVACLPPATHDMPRSIAMEPEADPAAAAPARATEDVHVVD